MDYNLMAGVGGTLLNSLDIIREYMAAISVIGFIYSAIQCFFGYRMFKFWVGVQAFVIFGIMGMAIGNSYFGLELSLIVGVILGWIGASIAMELYMLGVFLQCLTTGAIIGGLLGLVGQLGIEQTALLAITFGVVVGIIGVILTKPLIILSTGFSGGILLGCIIAVSSDWDILAGVFAGIIVSICGVLYQIYSDEQSPDTASMQDDNTPV